MDISCQFEDGAALKEALKNILWIGGATDSGKTTTAALFGERYGLPVYHGDQHWRENWAKLTPQEQPAMHRWDNMTMDERWVRRTVEDLAHHTFQIMTERLPFIFEDCAAMATSGRVIVEWFGLLPNCIAPLLTHPHQAVWLIGSEKFRLESINQRGKSGFHQDTADPEKAWDNHYRRDVLIAETLQQQAEALGLGVMVNEGHLSPQEMMVQVAEHFELI